VGQTGLAMSTVLEQREGEHVVLERRRVVGERWRTERWDSLRFQFPNWTLQLPGYAYLCDDPTGSPTSARSFASSRPDAFLFVGGLPGVQGSDGNDGAASGIEPRTYALRVATGRPPVYSSRLPMFVEVRLGPYVTGA
jgi:hypothetical protein